VTNAGLKHLAALKNPATLDLSYTGGIHLFQSGFIHWSEPRQATPA
jgi:hypothetical protein